MCFIEKPKIVFNYLILTFYWNPHAISKFHLPLLPPLFQLEISPIRTEFSFMGVAA